MCRGFERVKVLGTHPLFDDLPYEIRVPESHRQALASVPTGFECLGESASSKVEIMVHKSRPVYGFQFHPERADEDHPDGRVLIRTFSNWLWKLSLSSNGLVQYHGQEDY